MIHFEWLNLLPFLGSEHLHIANKLLICFILLGLTFLSRRALKKSENALIPSDHFSIKAFFENFVSIITSLSDLVVGSQGRKFIPFFSTLFIFIWFNNLLGLVPGMGAATSNVNTTLALGVFSFLVYNIYGFKEHGLSYLKQLMGPVLFLAPLMFVIELISHLVRPLSLGLRLYGNMVGDHTVLSIFLDLAPVVIPVAFYFLGFFVCTMQAFIFTILSMVYISIALSHEH
ncbi:MAG: F0F1 ATP synthase subunit A [Bdellovibrionales bacterium]|nr:F0F1 ATP synthase subunit A [Bdellovibrionales bacterium]